MTPGGLSFQNPFRCCGMTGPTHRYEPRQRLAVGTELRRCHQEARCREPDRAYEERPRERLDRDAGHAGNTDLRSGKLSHGHPDQEPREDDEQRGQDRPRKAHDGLLVPDRQVAPGELEQEIPGLPKIPKDDPEVT